MPTIAKQQQPAADGPDDDEVVRIVLNGDRDAYRWLVRRYQEVLYRHAVRMVDHPDVASDLVQRAFVKGYDRLDECRHPERVGGWLFRITSNLCKDYLKNRRRDNVALEDAGPLSTDRGGPDRDFDRSQLSDELDAALGQLTADQREAFLLKHLEGRSYEEMSDLLGASVSALKMRVLRARDTLQDLLEHYR